MAYRVELSLPREVVRGRDATLTLPVYSDANAEQTASGGTLSVWLGSTLLLDEVAITAGPPASYALAAATVPTTLALSDEWYERWTLTGTPAGVYTHTGYLVRTGYSSHVTDAALQDHVPEILNLLPPGETTCERFRRQASERIQRRLLEKGRRPFLIFDQWALFDAEVLYSLAAWANDAAQRTSGTSDYRRLFESYEARAEKAFDAVSFREDSDEDGLVDDAERESAAPSGVVLTAGRARRWFVGAYR